MTYNLAGIAPHPNRKPHNNSCNFFFSKWFILFR